MKIEFPISPKLEVHFRVTRYRLIEISMNDILDLERLLKNSIEKGEKRY